MWCRVQDNKKDNVWDTNFVYPTDRPYSLGNTVRNRTILGEEFKRTDGHRLLPRLCTICRDCRTNDYSDVTVDRCDWFTRAGTWTQTSHMGSYVFRLTLQSTSRKTKRLHERKISNNGCNFIWVTSGAFCLGSNKNNNQKVDTTTGSEGKRRRGTQRNLESGRTPSSRPKSCLYS